MEVSCESCVTAIPELKVIVSQLKCAICYEFMKTPMSTNCGHSFCSLCIRTWITTKQMCPTCQVEIRDESLRNNRALESCIDPYISLQNKLHELCKAGVLRKTLTKSTPSADNKSIDPVPKQNEEIRTEPNHVQVKQTPKPPPTPEHNRGATWQDTNSPAKIPAVFLTSPKSRNQIKPRTDIFTSPTSSSLSRLQNDGAGAGASTSTSTSTSTQSTTSKKVPCPVCSVEIPERNINIHLDKCLVLQENISSPSPRKPEVARREPLKKLVYNLMSEKDIRKKLKDFCLSTKGDRTQLVNRLQRYTVLYNSECDSSNPRPVAEIRKQIEKDEEALSKVAPATSKIFRISKNADPTEIEEFNKQYMNDNKSSFDDLIRQMRERQKKKDKTSSGETSPERIIVESTGTTSEGGKPDSNVKESGGVSKRNRGAVEDSDDEFSSSKRTPRTSKLRRIEDSDDDDFFLPNSAENSQEPKELKNHQSTNGKKVPRASSTYKHNISSSSSEDDILILDDNSPSPSSPVLSKTSPKDSNVRRGRGRPCRQQATGYVKKTEETPVEDRRQTRGNKENGKAAKCDDPAEVPARPTLRSGRGRQDTKPVRTVSRTPSLSPSRFQDNDRDSSETPEMVFETSRRFSVDGDGGSDEEMEDGQDNLSQFVSLMNEAGDSSNSSQEY